MRNFIGVLLGLFVGAVIITFGILIDKDWIEYSGRLPYEHWQRVVRGARDEFFIALLISGGVASTIGGIVTAIVVKNAKQAYAILIGFIFFIIAVADIIFTRDHPTWYEIGIFFVFFPFSWLGGKLVDFIYKKIFKKDPVTKVIETEE